MKQPVLCGFMLGILCGTCFAKDPVIEDTLPRLRKPLAGGLLKNAIPTPWDGFPKGSWVILTMDDKIEERAAKTRYKLTQITNAEQRSKFTHRVPVACPLRSDIAYIDDKFRDELSSLSFYKGGIDPFMLLTDTRIKLIRDSKASLTIDGHRIECDVAEYSLSLVGDKTTYVVWRHKGLKLPIRTMPMRSLWSAAMLSQSPRLTMGPDVLRAEMTVVNPVGWTTSATSQVVSFLGKQMVNGNETPCVIQHGTIGEIFRENKMQPTERHHATTIQWWSSSVPGHLVEHHTKEWRDGKLYRTLEHRIVDYYVPRDVK